jgi:transcriptional regulator with XRE-family HTH domain
MKKKRPVTTDIRNRFGDRIRELRAAKGYSQEKLAEMSSMHWTYLGGIERAERNPTLINIEKLAIALDVSLPELFMFKKKDGKNPENLNTL